MLQQRRFRYGCKQDNCILIEVFRSSLQGIWVVPLHDSIKKADDAASQKIGIIEMYCATSQNRFLGY